MKQVYLAHPLSAPTKQGVLNNIARAKAWYKWACDHYWPDYCFNAMWILNCEVYENTNDRDLEIGMQRNFGHIKRCDELWHVGIDVTTNMAVEGRFARRLGLPVYNLTGFEKPLTSRIEPTEFPLWQPGSLTEQVAR